MRNPNRIKSILENLEEYWNLNPDMRLGQLICNLINYTGEKNSENHIFFFEDDEFEKKLKEQIEYLHRLDYLSSYDA